MLRHNREGSHVIRQQLLLESSICHHCRLMLHVSHVKKAVHYQIAVSLYDATAYYVRIKKDVM